MTELKQLLLKHAQVKSGKGPELERLSGTPDLLNRAVLQLERTLRAKAREFSKAALRAELEELAAANSGLDFTNTWKLLGL